jgi:aminoglycoside phosphotransferase (APT) family kinase protein
MDVPAAYPAAIAAVRPDLAGAPLRLHTRGWDSDAVEAGGVIFKFPKHAEATQRLRREARLLALIGPRVPLRVPEMRLYEAPRVFSEHAMIPGEVLETHDYDRLSSAQQAALAAALAGFYAALHAIPVEEAVAAGVEIKPEWLSFEVCRPVLTERLPAELRDFATRAFAAYAALPEERQVLGYFDGHGWNMAFDRGGGVLNGLYDFADAGLGPPSRDFTYSNLTSGALTARIVAGYEQRTGRIIPRQTVAVRTAVHTLAELASDDADVDGFLAAVRRWHDYMQAQPDLRI